MVRSARFDRDPLEHPGEHQPGHARQAIHLRRMRRAVDARENVVAQMPVGHRRKTSRVASIAADT